MTKRAGLVGGLGPESTIDYYRWIIDLWRAEDPRSYPLVIIDSLDVDYGIHLVETDHERLVEYLGGSVSRLAKAGADFAAFAANTPHIVFDAVAEKSPIPLISIVEVTAEAARDSLYRRVLLLGTGFTMEGSFYPDVMKRYGVDLVVPNPEERAWIHETYMTELLRGVFRPEARDRVNEIVKRVNADDPVDAVILAGTELPLLLREGATHGLPVLDTTKLHVAAIVRRMRAG